MDEASLSDNDYLEQWKSNANGVDLNRNFDALWDSYADPAGDAENREKRPERIRGKT